jgi:histidinol-phosphatase (PHP family)
MFPFDYHMHTRFSGDNQADMEQMCRAAVSAGIREIAFTEHFDVNVKEPLHGQFPLREWSAELERCRDLFRGQLIIRAGLESSEPHTSPGEVAELIERYPFDIVIGSVHWVRGLIVFEEEYFQKPADEAFTAYFEEMERLARLGDFQVLGHLDVAARVGYEIYGSYDPRRYEDMIRSILRACIERGIVPEINTGAVRRGPGRLMPDLETLRWYVELGGEAVTVGSDAHRPEQVGLYLDKALEAARAAGVRYLVMFERRKAAMIPL